MPKIIINDREFDAPEGLNMIQAARLIGVEIPHFCYHPGLGTDGNCRLCLIEVEGVGKPQIACNTYVRDGLTIRTETEKIRELRKAVLEFFFLNHPLDCPICDQAGECLLQDFYMQHGQYKSRLDLPKHHKRKVVDLGPRVVLDAERCVLCRRCVRFCDQITGTGELRVISRGNHSEIGVFPGRPLENSYSLNTVDLCPVGALTSKDFRFKCRVWFLSSTESICIGCSRGCNTHLEHKDGTFHRCRPRENQEVNQWWMCDEGRMTYHRLNDNRCEKARSDGNDATVADALAQVSTTLRSARDGKGGESIAMVLSPDLSNESLFAAKKFAREALRTPRVLSGSFRTPTTEDEILRKADPHPNRMGAEILSLATEDLKPELDKGGEVLLIIQNDLVGDEPSMAEKISRFATVVYMTTHLDRTAERATVVLPIASHGESDGTFTNFQGRVQRFRRAMPPRGDAMQVVDLLREIARGLECDLGLVGLQATWKEIGSTIPEYEGITPERLGSSGLPIRSRTVSADVRAEGAE